MTAPYGGGHGLRGGLFAHLSWWVRPVLSRNWLGGAIPSGVTASEPQVDTSLDSRGPSGGLC